MKILIDFFLHTEAIQEFDRGEIHEDASLKCYMFCVFEVLDLISSKGDLFVMRLADHVESNYDEEIQNIVYQMGRKCLRPPDNENNCEKAFYYHKCWKSTDPVVSLYTLNLYVILPFVLNESTLVFIAALFLNLNIANG